MLLVTTNQAPPPPPPHVCATYGKWTSEERGKHGTTASFAQRQLQVMTTLLNLRLWLFCYKRSSSFTSEIICHSSTTIRTLRLLHYAPWSVPWTNIPWILSPKMCPIDLRLLCLTTARQNVKKTAVKRVWTDLDSISVVRTISNALSGMVSVRIDDEQDTKAEECDDCSTLHTTSLRTQCLQTNKSRSTAVHKLDLPHLCSRVPSHLRYNATLQHGSHSPNTITITRDSNEMRVRLPTEILMSMSLSLRRSLEVSSSLDHFTLDTSDRQLFTTIAYWLQMSTLARPGRSCPLSHLYQLCVLGIRMKTEGFGNYGELLRLQERKDQADLRESA